MGGASERNDRTIQLACHCEIQHQFLTGMRIASWWGLPVWAAAGFLAPLSLGLPVTTSSCPPPSPTFVRRQSDDLLHLIAR